MFKVLVVGDLMLDHYTHVTTNRQAAEVDIPVWDAISEEWRLGGAANVAHNLKSLGKDEIEVWVAGICANSYQMRATRSWIQKVGIQVGIVGGSEVMVKHRYVQNEKIIFRSDNMKKFSDASVLEYEKFFLNYAVGSVFDYDAIIFSDYDKGTITRGMVHSARANARPNTIFVVDSKRYDLEMFSGFDVCKLNAKEYGLQVAHPLYTNVESLFRHIVVTKGAHGSELRIGDPVASRSNRYVVHTEQFPLEHGSKTLDVTGCGDTHTAAMTFSLLKDNDLRKAIRFANFCASRVVEKFGTSTI